MFQILLSSCEFLIHIRLKSTRRLKTRNSERTLREIDTFYLVTTNGFAINALNTDSAGNSLILINGDADQSHTFFDLRQILYF
jgi:hypothetical protein